MTRTEHIALMATYNQWMNRKVYEAAGGLSDEELMADRGAFFSSILGTLNHLALGDRAWLKRFAEHPAGFTALAPLSALELPPRLDRLAFANLRELSAHRALLDQLIIEWVHAIREPDLDQPLAYRNMAGTAKNKNFYALLVHFFNHQTHHRGQVTTLLTQAGRDVGDTDLLALID
ncbi:MULTISPECIES: DinB family protein [unclassified Pseudomonas]|uniref:DinB family protein n=1 Tax=unclassified Pseudomonas TaxID=196821 RepID=UPI0015A127EC|nr:MULTISPECIES: DinB family protein [unclassified Pseudomonas]NWC92568.1 DinB family protein [Pseudomonas sp. IPO3779]NWD15566.1 DinB family protein [Pseudomonas sp. IPO3778]